MRQRLYASFDISKRRRAHGICALSSITKAGGRWSVSPPSVRIAGDISYQGDGQLTRHMHNINFKIAIHSSTPKLVRAGPTSECSLSQNRKDAHRIDSTHSHILGSWKSRTVTLLEIVVACIICSVRDIYWRLIVVVSVVC